jgi:ribonuclease HIII
VIAGKEAVRSLDQAAGVRDSKTVVEHADPETRCAHPRARAGRRAEVRYCGMPEYNELMARPYANLNRLLAWQHATASAQALKRRSGCRGACWTSFPSSR